METRIANRLRTTEHVERLIAKNEGRERIRRAAAELLAELESENPELLALVRQRTAFDRTDAEIQADSENSA